MSDDAGIKYSHSFEMRNRSNLVDYYLFHGTNHRLGLEKMKDAMWKVDASGEFSFSDSTDPNQIILLGDEPRLDILRDQIVSKLDGQIVTVREIEEFVVVKTAFRLAHYKGVLKKMEKDPPHILHVLDDHLRSRRWSFKDLNMRVKISRAWQPANSRPRAICGR
jgi:hypothetical protein